MDRHKNLVLHLILVFGLVSCADNKNDGVLKLEDKNIVEDSIETVQTDRFFNEFLSCTPGSDHSEENLKTMIAEFNALAISDEIAWIGGYAPVEGKNQNANWWWEIQWTSQQAAESGWEEWRADEAGQRWSEKFTGVLDCDDSEIFSYTTQFPAPDTIALEDWDSFAAAEIACNFNDGKSKVDLDANVAEFAHWLESNGTGTRFAYGIYMPIGEDPADFYWFNWHPNFEAMASGNTNWEANGAELAAKLADTATCADPNIYTGAEYYAAEES
ncbi:MAG: hypothetical protein CBD08_004630 [Cellvibrionales bacterium TMED148]|nr:hypothetical protein [Porticoccaceae bacterium]RPG90562.1 MAG: hypothetical protein CBD08_004630 [Cellvibrionales bacterium TMED148]